MLGGAAFGALFFAWIAGARILDPTQIEWLMKGDWVPHYFGWHYFRIEPWHWPPGTMHGYYAPLGTSIGLTDSIPLAAYVLKPFDRWLPADFQYIGPWLSAVLHAAGRARRPAWSAAGPTGLAAGRWRGPVRAAPDPARPRRPRRAVLALADPVGAAARHPPPAERLGRGAWAALGLAAAMVQPYLAAMVLAMLVAAAAEPAARGRDRAAAPWPPPVRRRPSAGGCRGCSSSSGDDSLTAGGLGYYSMNPLALDDAARLVAVAARACRWPATGSARRASTTWAPACSALPAVAAGPGRAALRSRPQPRTSRPLVVGVAAAMAVFA